MIQSFPPTILQKYVKKNCVDPLFVCDEMNVYARIFRVCVAEKVKLSWKYLPATIKAEWRGFQSHRGCEFFCACMNVSVKENIKGCGQG